MTPREQAAIDVAGIAADLHAARERLREAVKAEVRAMPPVPSATGFDAALRVVSAILGEPEVAFDRRKLNWQVLGVPEAIWNVDAGPITLYERDGKCSISAQVPDTEESEYNAWDADSANLDVALRAALLFLADRDVYLPARAP